MESFAVHLSPSQNGFVLLLLIHLCTCQYYLEEKPCAVLHSGQNLEGEKFPLTDGDQYFDFEGDYRESDSGWDVTQSVTVQNGCKLNLCNETCFDGACQTLKHGSYSSIATLNVTRISSASCVCNKECKCSDIYMKKSTCARAYLQGGCKTCNSLYADLEGNQELFSEDFVGKVEAFRLRKGCTLSLYPEEDFEGDPQIIEDEILENFNGEFRSYECGCNGTQFEPRVKPPRPASYPPLVEVPNTLDEVIKMSSDPKHSTHPGLRAAYMSARNKRSSRNAYILVLGSPGAGKSSAMNLLFDNPNVTRVGDLSTTSHIHEFRIPVPVDEIGVANSELRVIDTPGLGDTRGLVQDATFLATLDAYLANHEELKDRIPNVVLIFIKESRRFGPGPHIFVKMLRALDAFSERITDKNYSNVIFVLSHFSSLTRSTQRRPEFLLSRYKTVIEKYTLLPKPTLITVAENRGAEHELPMVNGYFRLPNKEYYPRNLFEKIELVTEKAGDMIGLGVFRSAFRDSDDFNVNRLDFPLLTGSSKVKEYLHVLAESAMVVINKTEVSKLLQNTWDEKIDSELKRRFPSSISHLQKVLSLRNINTMDDVPKTTAGILKLLTVIKRDEASKLLKKSLNIQAPLFTHNTVAGYSYDVFKDTNLSSSPFKLGDKQDSDIGFLIPSMLASKLDLSTRQIFKVFDNRKDYIQYRIKSLGIEGNIANFSFEGEIKPGHNIKEKSFRADCCSLSATLEFRLFDFVLNDRLHLNDAFQYAVKKLPVYSESSHEAVEQWKQFFAYYGTHVVKSAYGGGAIQIQLESNEPCGSWLAQALYDLVKFLKEMSIPFITLGQDEEDASEIGGNVTNIKIVLPKGTAYSLTFIGGDPAHHTADLTKMSVKETSKLIGRWRKSLKFNPVVLTTEMRLIPLSQVVKRLGQNYTSEIERATFLMYQSEMRYFPPKKIGLTTPGPPRDQTPLMSECLKMHAESDQKVSEMLLSLRSLEDENEEVLLQYEMEKREYERTRMWSELEEHEDSLARARPERMEQERAFRAYQSALQERMTTGQDNAARLTWKLFETISQRSQAPNDGSCLLA